MNCKHTEIYFEYGESIIKGEWFRFNFKLATVQVYNIFAASAALNEHKTTQIKAKGIWMWYLFYLKLKAEYLKNKKKQCMTVQTL